ncbi:MAG TPA: hypothetical protein VKD26_13915 [Streptosporangiaceae bacterium]|nr:hypothetical protein [Streptosporangiaceae bacterium]
MRDEPDDTELEEQLRQVAARFEPVPPDLMRTAVGAYTWRTIDADLAELVFDSAVDDDEAALVRGAPQGRLLSFRSSGLTIDVEVTGGGSRRNLIGQLVPPGRAAIEIRQGGDVVSLDADELGRFTAGPFRAGPIRLRLSGAAQAGPRRVVTDWVSI